MDMLDASPTIIQGLVGQLLLQGELLAPGSLRRHEDVHLRQRECQEAQILIINRLPAGSEEGGLLNAQIMHTATMGRTQKQGDERGIDQQEIIFYRLVFFLAAITRFLLSKVLRADDASFRSVMGKGGTPTQPRIPAPLSVA